MIGCGCWCFECTNRNAGWHCHGELCKDQTPIPELVTPGHDRIIDHGKVQTVWWPNGEVGLRHHCTRPRDGRTLIVAPRLQLDGGHTIVSTDPVTVTPSCGCDDCGLHGFLTDGVWRDC